MWNFFVLPDQNTFHAIKSFFFLKTKLSKRHIISISFVKSFSSSFFPALFQLLFMNVIFSYTSESGWSISPWLKKQIAQYRWAKIKGKIYIQSLTDLWALVQCRRIDKEFNVHQSGENSFRLMHQKWQKDFKDWCTKTGELQCHTVTLSWHFNSFHTDAPWRRQHVFVCKVLSLGQVPSHGYHLGIP